MSASPDISVVLGVFNGGETLAATVESILDQRDVSFELVAVDDGSRDGSGEMLERYAARDPRMVVIRQENRGLTRALRRGCEIARGRLIARHDAGDLSHPRRLALQQELIERDATIAFVSCWTRYIAAGGEELKVEYGDVADEQPIAILDASKPWGVIGGPTSHGSVIMRREAYERAGGYREEFYFGQDWDLWYRLAAIGRFAVRQQVLYTMRVTPGSISTSSKTVQEKLAKLSLAAMRARAAGEDESPILAGAAAIRPPFPQRRTVRADGLYFIGETLRRRGDPAAARYLRRAIAARPWMLRAWIRWMQARAVS
ncbi:MAG: glycosyltransferase family 2 protein [Thermoanaerobaculia bacterium]